MPSADHRIVSETVIDPLLDKPKRFDGAVFHNTAMLWLGLQHKLSGLSENLKKIGLIKGESVPNWIKYILTKAEWNHGLATAEKGEWSCDFVFKAKSEDKMPLLKQKFATSMMWQMTKNINGDNNNLVVKLEYVRRKNGEIKNINPVPGSREWPIYVRVLKSGNDGKPVAFVDVKVDKSSDVDQNPYDQIDWQRIIGNDEQYIEGLSGIVGEQRGLEDWYQESMDDNKYGQFFRPDIVIGNNTQDFSVNNMSADRRSLLSIGFDENLDSMSGVKVSSVTHLPYVGKHMLGQAPTEKNPSLSISAYEATINDPDIQDLLDDKNSNDLENYVQWRRYSDENVYPMQSFLSTRFASTKPDERVQIETMLRYGSFENKVMAKFAALVDTHKMAVGKTIAPDLAKELKAMPKKLKAEGKAIAGILFFNFAIFLQGFRSQGYAISPNDESKLLAYGSISNGPLRRIQRAMTLMKGAKNEARTFEKLDEMAVIADCRKLVDDKIDSGDALYTLFQQYATINFDNLTRVEAVRAALIEDTYETYRSDMDFVKNGLTITDNQMLASIKSFHDNYGNTTTKEVEVVNPSIAVRCNLADFLSYQESIFTELKDMTVGGGDLSVEEQDDFSSFSAEIMHLGDLRKNFPLTSYDINSVLNEIKSSLNIDVADAHIDWKTTNKVDLSSKIDVIRERLRTRVIERYKKDGVKYLLSEAERESVEMDSQNIGPIYNDLLSKSLSASEIVNELMKHPNRSVVDISVRLGLLRVFEKFGESGATQIIASVRPDDNASKLVTKDRPGVAALFETALGATRTTRGFAQENDRFTLKESIDNPRNMLDVIVPLLRGDRDLSAVFRSYLLRCKVDDHTMELFKRVVFDDEFACFADETIKDEYITDQARLWGSKYEEKLAAGALSAKERTAQLREATILFDHFSGFLEESNKGSILIDDGTTYKLKEFMHGGFAKKWDRVNEFRMQAIHTELARVLLLFAMSPGDDAKRLELRTIYRREKAILQNMHISLRELFVPVESRSDSVYKHLGIQNEN